MVSLPSQLHIITYHPPRTRWIVSQINAVYSTLDTRVKADVVVAKAEEERKKKEKEELVYGGRSWMGGL